MIYEGSYVLILIILLGIGAGLLLVGFMNN